jgi:hypothetical protein
MAINRVLDIKAVQWALLAATAALLLFSGVQSFRLWVQGVSLKSAKAEAADSKAFLEVQNSQVLELKRQGDEAKEKAKKAIAEATEIAISYSRKVEAIRKQPIREDCCGAIEDAKNIILGGVP